MANQHSACGREISRWQINCLEMEAVRLALQNFLPFVKCGGGIHQSPGRNALVHPAGLGKMAALVGRSGASRFEQFMYRAV